jgi:diketogulonate reductase-like aldo/keto reductase
MTRLALVAYCESHGIVLEAWAPLVRGEKFNHPVLIELGQKYSKTPAQILVRYGIEKGFIVIPKSIKEERIVQNAHVFDFQLAESDVMRLDALDENLITDWDVSEIE